MSSPLQTQFGAVFRNEILLNSKRVAPYVLMVLFVAHALLWWLKGPAVRLGWAINSDYYIFRNFLGFSFLLGLPIFNAVIMGDSVIRDFRLGIDPLIFSKPIHRVEYLLGKFFGNFFVLVCCTFVFSLTLFVLQFFPTSRMIVQPFQVVPYVKHFLLIVVVTHFLIGSFYFTVGTLTRSAKIVYGLAAAFYPLFVVYGLVGLSRMPMHWRTFFDMFLLSAGPRQNGFGETAEYLNQLVVSYTPLMIANRVLVVFAAAVCLTILCLRFAIAEYSNREERFTIVNLATPGHGVYFDAGTFTEIGPADVVRLIVPSAVSLPKVTRTTGGIAALVDKLRAALSVEFRVLRAERSLIVLLPLAIVLSIFDVAFFRVVPEISYSVTYASSTANALLLFILGLIVFYTGEAMHRERELRVEPVLWSAPTPNTAILFSKFLVTVSLSLMLMAAVVLTSIAVQLVRGHTPVEIGPFLRVYGILLLPDVIFIAGVSVFLNVLLRNKYVVYIVSIGTSAALFYLYSIGHNHWLYNPVLYRLWTYASLSTILWQRLYWILVAAACVALAHVLFERKSR
ncbi:MAG TPA: ABC transporter permease [Pyrinomonadaceae bacterium]|nr:ABC transporter permease [Pyrinomonadaceae bacterium]